MHIQTKNGFPPAPDRHDDLSSKSCFAFCRCGLRPAFFFEGAIRLTEGETLNCAERASYDRVRAGRFFDLSRLKGLSQIYLHKFHLSHFAEGRDWGGAYEIKVGEDPVSSTEQAGGKKSFIYVNHPLKLRGFELYRDKEGYSPLFVLRDMTGKVIYGAYAPLQSIEQKDGTYIYRSGSADAPGSFDFPQATDRSPVFKLQTIYYPDKGKNRTGAVFFQVRQFDPGEGHEELFRGRAAFGERVKAGDFLLSMDEVRYWASVNVIYRPGMQVILYSFWLGLGGIVLNVILKTSMASGIRFKT